MNLLDFWRESMVIFNSGRVFMPAKKKYEYVKQEIEKRGYFLISTTYKDSKTKLLTKCPAGHSYEASYNSFSRGYRCSECAGLKKRTIEEIREFMEKEKYVLLSTGYSGNKSKLLTKCPVGHDFYIRWNDFQQGYRCNECAGNKKKTIEQIRLFLNKHGYILLDEEYENNSTKLNTVCPEGHEHSITWCDFKQGYRCAECNGTKKKTIEEVRSAFSDSGYKLISHEYKHNKSLLHSKCPKGHDFYVRWNDFYKGIICSSCSLKGTSKPEQELFSILKASFPDLIKKSFSVNVPNKPHIHWFQVDIFNPKTKLGIEYDGQYHHSEEYMVKNKTKHGWPVEDAINYHSIKDSVLWDCHGVKIIHIKGEDWKANKQACIDRCLEFLSTGC